jgi:hypothetical protein
MEKRCLLQEVLLWGIYLEERQRAICIATQLLPMLRQPGGKVHGTHKIAYILGVPVG